MTIETDSLANGAGPRNLPPPIPERDPTGSDAVREADFPVVLRGYDRAAVDHFLAELADLIDVLEARQAREAVVQRALDEVGVETSAILKQAHESADEVTARSRAQAEERLERARDEAAEILSGAHQLAAQLERDTEDLWAKRRELLEDLRVFGDEAKALAYSASERFAPPLAGDGVDDPETDAGIADMPTEEFAPLAEHDGLPRE